MESYVYSFMKIAGAKEVIQWGFDETTLDGQTCANLTHTLSFTLTFTLTIMDRHVLTSGVSLNKKMITNWSQ